MRLCTGLIVAMLLCASVAMAADTAQSPGTPATLEAAQTPAAEVLMATG